MTAHILVVEDEPAISELITLNLRHGGFKVTQVSSAEQADWSLRGILPDLILLDWMLPGQSGVALARKLRGESRTKNLPIILLTARVDEDDKVQGLESGADDYIAKPFSPRELVARVRALLRRRSPELAEEALQIGRICLNPASHQVDIEGAAVDLGPTEFRLLRFFMSHSGRVFSRVQLLDKVWGEQVYIEERTVDVHIRRLRAALTPFGEEVRVETVRGAGYRFVDEPLA